MSLIVQNILPCGYTKIFQVIKFKIALMAYHYSSFKFKCSTEMEDVNQSMEKKFDRFKWNFDEDIMCLCYMFKNLHYPCHKKSTFTKIQCTNVMSELKELDVLDLSSCNIKRIQPSTFASLSKLRFLNLFKNDLRLITNEMFSNCLNNLEELNLSYNKIQKINENSFQSLTNLKKLNLYYNKIEELNSNSFNGLTSLEELNLSYNQIMLIKPNAFDSLYKLKKLKLGWNKLNHLKKNLFKHLDNLEELDLKFNKIKAIEENTFQQLTNLRKFKSDWIHLEQHVNDSNSLSINKLKHIESLIDSNKHIEKVEDKKIAENVSKRKLGIRRSEPLSQQTNSLVSNETSNEKTKKQDFASKIGKKVRYRLSFLKDFIRPMFE